MEFAYDATGKRISKKVIPKNGDKPTTTYYIYDAGGNIMATYQLTDVEDPQNPGAGINLEQLQVKEFYVYGSSRLGVDKVTITTAEHLYAVADGSTVSYTYNSLQPQTTYTLKLGNKNYELTNHLGNVMVVVTDKKGRKYTSNGWYYFMPDIVSVTDYYPFGMVMEQRSWSIKEYRFGFNGKESDNEVSGSGTQYDYGFRIYNPRLGKFLSVDPLTNSYPMLTPYQFASNMPIVAIDLDGLEAVDAKSATAMKNVKVTTYEKNQWRLSYTYKGIEYITHFDPNGMGETALKWDIFWGSAPNVKVMESFVLEGGVSYDFSMKVAELDKIAGNYADISVNGVGNTFRHLLGSASLTAMFGGDWAKTITDPHEVSDIGNGSTLSDDVKVDLLNNSLGRQYAKNNGLIASSIVESEEKTANFLNDLVVYTLSSVEEYKNDPAYSDLISGKTKMFKAGDKSVKSFKENIEHMLELNKKFVTDANKTEENED